MSNLPNYGKAELIDPVQLTSFTQTTSMLE